MVIDRIRVPILFALVVAACGAGRLEVTELTGSAMGTTWTVKLVAAPADLSREGLQSAIVETLERVESLMSTYREESALSKFNASRSTGWVEVPAELCESVQQALTLSGKTGGAFDVTVGPLVNLWGFGPDGVVLEPPGSQQISELLATVGFAKLRALCTVPALRKTEPGLYVDLSAWAKGYAVDRVAALLDERRLPDYLVEIGGEMRMRGANASGEDWAIAIERPVPGQRELQAIVRLTDTAMATSGDYRNYFEHDGRRYSHTIDPRTGSPVTHRLASVTVVHESAAFADAMATALLVMGPDDGLEFAATNEISAYFLIRDDDGIVEIATQGFRNLIRSDAE